MKSLVEKVENKVLSVTEKPRNKKSRKAERSGFKAWPALEMIRVG